MSCGSVEAVNVSSFVTHIKHISCCEALSLKVDDVCSAVLICHRRGALHEFTGIMFLCVFHVYSWIRPVAGFAVGAQAAELRAAAGLRFSASVDH